MRAELEVILKSSGYFSFLQQVVLTDEQCGLLFSPFPYPRMHLGKIMQSSQVSCRLGVVSGERCVGLGQSKKLSHVLFSILHSRGAGMVHLWSFSVLYFPSKTLFPPDSCVTKRNSALRSLGPL